MAGPKIVVIGAGSYFFGRPVIWNMAHSEILREGTLSLVDTDPKVLKTMMDLAGKVFEHTGVPTRLEGSTDRREVLADADFVVLSFSNRNTHFRRMDCQISAKHGVRMCSGDTIGPGGVFRALREVPHALAMAKDTAELAPNAWLINFVNPTSVFGMALQRYAREIRSFALCDGHHEPYNTLHWCRHVGILPEDAPCVPPEVRNKLDLKIGGVNHNTWMVRFRYDGKDYMPVVREKLAENAVKDRKDPNVKAKPRLNQVYALHLMDTYGIFPTAISHTKEYVPFFQGYSTAPIDPEPIAIFDADIREQEMAESWKKNEQYVSGEQPITQFIEDGRGDHATDIIESMWGNLGKSFYINSPNRGAITNLPDDAFVELRSDVDMNGPRPQPFGEFPRGVLALQHQTLDTHELTAEAAVTCDRDILLRALATDPIINSLDDAKNIMHDALEAQRDVLPQGWFK